MTKIETLSQDTVLAATSYAHYKLYRFKRTDVLDKSFTFDIIVATESVIDSQDAKAWMMAMEKAQRYQYGLKALELIAVSK